MGSQNDFIISILEVYAQAQSQARSENIKWGIAKGFKDGSSKLYNRKCFGYHQDQEGELIIDEEEAQIIQYIFNIYLNRYSVTAIIRELETLGIKSPTGKDRWHVEVILKPMMLNAKALTIV